MRAETKMEPTNPIDYSVLRRKAMAVAAESGFHSHAQDFAQEVCLKVSQGRQTTLDNLLTDFLRHYFGDNRAVHQDRVEAKREIESRYADLKTNDRTPAQEHMSEMDFFAHLKGLEVQERAMLVLRFKWDLSLMEIGEVMGVSESRISQQLTATLAKLRKRLRASKLSP